jgi:prepilin-type N-terminal cleavage/methylation domain-containing protein
MKKNQKGFTLIELLVVIAIIGLLSTLAVVALNNARQKARDARRLSDVKQLQTALELYYTNASQYPATAGLTAALVPTYMGQIPTNPTPRNDGGCSGADYAYTMDLAGASYHIVYCIGSQNNAISGGVDHNASPAGIANP